MKGPYLDFEKPFPLLRGTPTPQLAHAFMGIFGSGCPHPEPMVVGGSKT